MDSSGISGGKSTACIARILWSRQHWSLCTDGQTDLVQAVPRCWRWHHQGPIYVMWWHRCEWKCSANLDQVCMPGILPEGHSDFKHSWSTLAPILQIHGRKWKAAAYNGCLEAAHHEDTCASTNLGSGFSSPSGSVGHASEWVSQGWWWPAKTNDHKPSPSTQGHSGDGQMSLQETLHVPALLVQVQGLTLHRHVFVQRTAWQWRRCCVQLLWF